MATGLAQSPTVSLTSTSSTNKVVCTNFVAGPNGSRIKSVSMVTGPTTAPGGTYTVTFYLFDGTNYWPFDQEVLVNAVNTLILDEKLYPNKVCPLGWQIFVSVSTALTSGATVYCVFSTVDL